MKRQAKSKKETTMDAVYSAGNAPAVMPTKRRFTKKTTMIAFILLFAIVGTFLLFKSFAVTTSYDSTILADKPVAYWAMNGTSGTEGDLSGNNHTGSYKNGTPVSVNMINGDKAADFNGSNQYVSIPSSAAFSISTTKHLTWEAWIRPDTLQWDSKSDPYSYGYIDWMGKCAQYSPTCEWESRMYSTTNSQNRCNRLSAYVFNSSAHLGSGADWQPNCNLLQSGQWLHVVGEYQTETTPSGCNSAYPGSIDIWVNGVKWNQAYHMPTGCMSQYSINPTANNSPLNIGTMALDSWFKGAVGKVAIYNYSLSQTQISAHFKAMTGADPSGSCANTCTTPVPTQTGSQTTADTQAPAVSLTTPTSGATVSGNVILTASATDNVGVTKVDFYDGTSLLGSSTASPYSYTWNASAASGTHSLSTKAYDAAGNIGLSSAVSVTVSNSTADITAPSTPTGLASTAQTDTSISLSWKASTDNVSVKGYKVYRYGPTTNTATATGTTLTDNGLTASTSYSYAVSAFDAAGNESPQSSVITVSTKAGTVLPPPTGGLTTTVTKGSTWDSGYCANVSIKNTGTVAVSSWSIPITINGKVTSLWNAKWTQSGSTLTISNLSWNGAIKAGAMYTSVGFCAAL